jgi:hypothetical protein
LQTKNKLHRDSGTLVANYPFDQGSANVCQTGAAQATFWKTKAEKLLTVQEAAPIQIGETVEGRGHWLAKRFAADDPESLHSQARRKASDDGQDDQQGAQLFQEPPLLE